MTEPQYLVAVQRAAPDGAILRPALRIDKRALDKALCNPSAMGQYGQVNVDERISRSEPLPGRRDAAIAVDDPLILVQDVSVYLEILLLPDLAAACAVLEFVDRIQR